MATGQTLSDLLQEEARLRALDDPMVIGRRDREDLAETDLSEHPRIGGLEPCGVRKRAHADDRPLARHEPRHRLNSPDRARIGQRDSRSGEIVWGNGAAMHLADEVFVRPQEAGEVEGVCILDARHHERPRAVWSRDINSEAKPDVLMTNDAGGSLLVDRRHERGIERRHRLEGTDHGKADEVREAHLGPGGANQLLVERCSVHLEQSRRHGPHRGGGRHAEALLHVRHDATSRPPQCHCAFRRAAVARFGRGSCARRRRRRYRRCLWLVVSEELSPALGDRGGVGQEPLVHVIDQPGVGSERASTGRCRRCTPR